MITGLGDCLPASGPLALVAVWKSMGGFSNLFLGGFKEGVDLGTVPDSTEHFFVMHSRLFPMHGESIRSCA